MTYGEIKNAVLQLINQHTIAGESVAGTYNNQADYLLKIPNLINQGLTKIRTTTRPNRETAELTDGTVRGGWRIFPLPENCRQIVTGGVSAFKPMRWGVSHRTPHYRLLGRSIAVPSDHTRVWIEYEAQPVQLPAAPDDDWALAEEPEVIQAAIYYAAAMLVQMEDEFTYASLMNEYEDRRTNLSPHATVELENTWNPVQWETYQYPDL